MSHSLAILTTPALLLITHSQASDPETVSDFNVPNGADESKLDGVFFTYTDSNGKLYKNVLQKGDVFVFPKGLPHYQANFDKTNKAVAVAAFGSSNAGTVSLPKSLFGSNIDNEVLTKAFKISADNLQQLRAGQN
ncbi:hypothetical protein ACSBR2_003187 [Camellia fascicularis]